MHGIVGGSNPTLAALAASFAAFSAALAALRASRSASYSGIKAEAPACIGSCVANQPFQAIQATHQRLAGAACLQTLHLRRKLRIHSAATVLSCPPKHAAREEKKKKTYLIAVGLGSWVYRLGCTGDQPASTCRTFQRWGGEDAARAVAAARAVTAAEGGCGAAAADRPRGRPIGL